jgi:NDP-sugar pyrophosphorylase family protein
MKSKLDLVILCGGKGSRLGNITKSTAKPLLKIDNIRFVELLINFYKKFDIDRIFLLTYYKKKQFKKLIMISNRKRLLSLLYVT